MWKTQELFSNQIIINVVDQTGQKFARVDPMTFLHQQKDENGIQNRFCRREKKWIKQTVVMQKLIEIIKKLSKRQKNWKYEK